MPDPISESMENAVDQAVRTQGRFEDTARTLGVHMNFAETNIAAAFSLSPVDDPQSKSAVIELAKKLGVPENQQDKIGVQGLQLLAQNIYQRVERAFGVLQQLIMDSHQQMMAIIRNIGR